jgi:hypothetical protein
MIGLVFNRLLLCENGCGGRENGLFQSKGKIRETSKEPVIQVIENEGVAVNQRGGQVSGVFYKVNCPH